MFSSLILAAGKSSRFDSVLNKTLYRVKRKSCLKSSMSFTESPELKDFIDNFFLVVSEKKFLETDLLDFDKTKLKIVEQDRDKSGTLGAVLSALDLIKDEYVLVSYGDTPFVSSKNAKDLIEFFIDLKTGKKKDTKCDGAMCFFKLKDDEKHLRYGRPILELNDEKNMHKTAGCLEFKSNPGLAQSIPFAIGGLFCFRVDFLKKASKNIKKNTKSGELYLTDVFNAKDGNFYSLMCDRVGFLGINSSEDVFMVYDEIKRKTNKVLLQKGVGFNSNQNNSCDEDTVFEPGVFLDGEVCISKSKIGSSCFIGFGSVVESSVVEKGVVIGRCCVVKNSTIKKGSKIKDFSIIEDSVVGSSSSIGPYCKMLSSETKDGVELGSFIEVKRSFIDEKTKAKHFGYVGDARIGKNVNIGAGVVFANYDGKNKNKSEIEDGSFVGSLSCIVAPVKIAKHCVVGCLSMVKNSIEKPMSLFFTSKQGETRQGWNKK